ncbi:hypothetical protein C8Q80DRAFT_899036 [Daedaleopsis nitida]|nr:hypothetical protein C8Q80DRAFT_899036 [Daedaleopsis nitida]
MSLYKDALAMEEGSLQGRLVLFSMTTLTIYDLCLHIHKDVAFVWRRGPNIINVLYVINRYLWPVSFIMQDILVFPVNDLVCAYLPYFVNILRMILYIHWSVFSAFRTYALSHRNHLLSTTVFVLGAAFIAPNLYMLIGPGARTANSPPPSNCTTVGNFDPVLLHMRYVHTTFFSQAY